MKCYFCYSAADDKVSQKLYFDMLKVAISSALKNTDLEIVVLYDGDVAGDDYLYLKSLPINVINHKFSCANFLEKTYPKEWMMKTFGRVIDYSKLAGTFMRLDIPFVEKEEDYVIYADVDVLFYNNYNWEKLPKPQYLLAGPEFVRDPKDIICFNAGILYMNVKSMRTVCSRIFKKLRSGIKNKINLFDQGYLNEECLNVYELLPLELNWKPYWGYNKSAIIVHFHGMKPSGSCENSGFAMDRSVYSACFENVHSDIPGYIIFLKEYFYYLGVNNDKWIDDHVKDVFNYLCVNNAQGSVSGNVKFKDVKKYFRKKIKNMFVNVK